jgi:hypothetical protein
VLHIDGSSDSVERDLDTVHECCGSGASRKLTEAMPLSEQLI